MSRLVLCLVVELSTLAYEMSVILRWHCYLITSHATPLSCVLDLFLGKCHSLVLEIYEFKLFYLFFVSDV